MRRNLLREKLRAGTVLIGANLTFPSPAVVEFCGHLGFDWIFIDGEHGGVGVETCYSLVTAADAVGLASVVRVPSNDASSVLSYAETGAHALIAPHIVSASDAERLVRYTNYRPAGARGFFSTSRAANYGLTQTAREWAEDNASKPLTIAMIEDVEALDALTAMTTVPGLDAFFIGPADLAMSMGVPGGATDPEVQARVRGAAQHLKQLGKLVGTTFIEGGQEAARNGVRLLAISVGGILAAGARPIVQAMRAIAE
jgi:2-keto-3-deoxy-L-rhamnonate aldolase RhmA